MVDSEFNSLKKNKAQKVFVHYLIGLIAATTARIPLHSQLLPSVTADIII